MIYKTEITCSKSLLSDLYGVHILALDTVGKERSGSVVFDILETKKGAVITLFSLEPINETSEKFPLSGTHFCIRLNPIFRSRSSRKLTPIPDADLGDWIARKLAEFPIGNFRFTPQKAIQIRKADGNTFPMSSTRVFGEFLEDSALLEGLEGKIMAGVGRGKAFGFGTFHILNMDK